MPRQPRFRDRYETYRGKTYLYLNEHAADPPLFDSPASYTHYSYISDYTGSPVVPSELQSLQRKGVMRANGLIYDQGRSVKCEDVPFVGFLVDSLDETLLPAPNGWNLSTIAGTNPSRPVFTPPQMIQDLVTLPRLIKETGDFLRNPRKLLSARQAANAHLATRFGWAPLIEDLGKLLKLQETILKRSKELDKLYSGKGLRRRLKFEETTETASGLEYFAGPWSAIVTCKVTMTCKRRTWATIRWKPLSPPPYSPDDESKNRLVQRLIFGVTPEGMAKGLWDVIPWTWLLGWFTNIGKYTLLYSNTVPAGHGEACFMSERQTIRKPGVLAFSGGAKGNLRCSGTVTTTHKTRIVAPSAVLPGFNMPFMDISKLSILGSLAAQRFLR